MLTKILIILLIISPCCNGLTYLFVSNFPMNPYCKVAKYKNIDDDYKYKNKQAGIVYTILGLIIAMFLLVLCFLYDFFYLIDPLIKLVGLYLIIHLVEAILFDTILALKFYQQNDENDE